MDVHFTSFQSAVGGVQGVTQGLREGVEPQNQHGDEEAREEAMAEAKAKAEQLAQLAGVTLDKPTFISKGIQTPVIQRSAVMVDEGIPAPMEVGTSISPGELEITLTVQVAYAIK